MSVTSIQLKNFKTFSSFSVKFAEPTSVLVGPNNAGKSTVASALRVAAGLIRRAKSRPAPPFKMNSGLPSGARPLDTSGLNFDEENLQYEYQQLTTQIDLHLRGGHRLHVVWPWDDGERLTPYYILKKRNGEVITKVAEARNLLPSIGVVPVLAPVERYERKLSRDHVMANRTGRLASRHFRNNLLLLRDEPGQDGAPTRLDEFLVFAHQWLPDVPIQEPVERSSADGEFVDLFYREGRHPKELSWAGDGVQVFLQLLLHLFRMRGDEVAILDEPDILLHADLQRRLFRVADSIANQVIITTHSAEIVAEADPSALIWVDKSRRKAVEAPSPEVILDLGKSIGSGFNLRLAKALRTKVVLFVEGDDSGILTRFASTLGEPAFESEQEMSIVSLRGGSNASGLGGFNWIAEEFLGGSVAGLVLLDRDFHSEAYCRRSSREIGSVSGMRCFYWSRHEIENYLVNSRAIADLTGLDREVTDEIVRLSIEEGMVSARNGFAATQLKEPEAKGHDPSVVIARALEEFETRWASDEDRVAIVEGKEVLAAINRRVQAAGADAVSKRRLAAELDRSELHADVKRVVSRVSELLS